MNLSQIFLLVFGFPVFYLLIAVFLNKFARKTNRFRDLIKDLLNIIEKFFFLWIRIITHFTIPIYKCVILYVLLLFLSYTYFTWNKNLFRITEGNKPLNHYPSQTIDLYKNEEIFIYAFENMLPFSLLSENSKIELYSPLHHKENLDSLISCEKQLKLIEERNHNYLMLYLWNLHDKANVLEEKLSEQLIQDHFEQSRLIKFRLNLIEEEDAFQSARIFVVIQKVLSGIFLYIYLSGLNKLTRRTG